MKHPKTAYELSQSQVSTPERVIDLFWQLTHERRGRLDRVLDLGAGDCRFAKGGRFRQYVGIEIDPLRAQAADLSTRECVVTGCAFRHEEGEYDACIGNPPYVRHHDIETPWKDCVVADIQRSLGIRLNKRCNLFLYFMCLGLLKTREDGIVAFVVPYEWVSRPSAEPIRALIRKEQWTVDVYRFSEPIFQDVLTTASITIVDKRRHSGKWSYFDVSSDLSIRRRQSAADNPRGVLEYAERGILWAHRGLSPGSQSIFCLTEGERVHNGIRRSDVMPCVTTLKHVPRSVQSLTAGCFKRYFVDAGERCWLIKSFQERLSVQLTCYLDSVAHHSRNNYTCNSRETWYRYASHPIASLLVGSGFTSFGPKVLRNPIGAHAVGSVTGIHSRMRLPTRALQEYLLGIDFEKLVVPHAKSLKKVEVRQLNSVLNTFAQERLDHASRSS